MRNSIEKKCPKQESGAQLTDQEILEGKEKELEEITKSYLENLNSEEIGKRENAQKHLAKFLETASVDEKKYAETMRRLFGLQHRDWAKLGFKTELVEVNGKKQEIPSILAEYGEEASDELKAQSFKFEKTRDKVSIAQVERIEELVDAAYPEYWLVQYLHEKEDAKKKAKEDQNNPIYG